jgi:hypothetical protein
MREMTSNGKDDKLRWLYRIMRWSAWTLGSLFALVIALYLAALCDIHYGVRRAMRVYNQALTVRLGDTVDEFNRKVPGCKVGKTDGESNCHVAPITQRIEAHFDWYMMDAHEDAYLWQSVHRQNIGLRDWYFVLRVTMHQGLVSELSAQFIVVGRDMALGCSWGLMSELPRGSLGIESAMPANARTALSVTHITSNWSGWGYRMEFTPGSDEQDLRMREINASCLTSFTGCRDSRELLPNLPPAGHPRYW